MRRDERINPLVRFLTNFSASSDRIIPLAYLWLMKNRTRATVVVTRTANADSASLLAKLIGRIDAITIKTAGIRRNADDILFTFNLSSADIKLQNNGENIIMTDGFYFLNSLHHDRG
ncbi:hypothetical protein D6D85_04150 [Candidatus Methanodesulfokora washburnensis]|uniref:Uncharacterized protein n=1 Tax=Candidatus Methanodesulfokora washburnensis TaxID=2478471 RepID=A0A3R9R6Y3_9CREN|nr:hypothetical protein D6D85_04150 [Candidatus Methanodesulfokores washburnensis]